MLRTLNSEKIVYDSYILTQSLTFLSKNRKRQTDNPCKMEVISQNFTFNLMLLLLVCFFFVFLYSIHFPVRQLQRIITCAFINELKYLFEICCVLIAKRGMVFYGKCCMDLQEKVFFQENVDGVLCYKPLL